MPAATGKEKFFGRLETLITEARRLRKTLGFDEQEPEEATKQKLLEPLLQTLGFASDSNYTREFKVIGDSVDYLLKSDRPLIFVEAKSLLDKSFRKSFRCPPRTGAALHPQLFLTTEIEVIEQCLYFCFIQWEWAIIFRHSVAGFRGIPKGAVLDN